MGDVIFRFISRGSLVPLTIIIVMANVILTAVLGDQSGGKMKELELNTFTFCKIRTTVSMLEPTAQNLTDVISMAPCYFAKKHAGEVFLGDSPEISPVAIAACVLLWIITLIFSMALIYGRD